MLFLRVEHLSYSPPRSSFRLRKAEYARGARYYVEQKENPRGKALPLCWFSLRREKRSRNSAALDGRAALDKSAELTGALM